MQTQTKTLNKMKDTFKQFQVPFQELTALNIKAFQNISYVKPDELSHLQRPEEFFEKNVAVFIDNGHKMLDYFQNVAEILERHLLSTSEKIKEDTTQMMQQTRSTIRKNTLKKG